ncbi:MAG: TlpA family protein disulfide reductase [Bacteroidetes bacterium]|nr:TlpA family protein disulfide reductase [Bacteroidota bacterium]
MRTILLVFVLISVSVGAFSQAKKGKPAPEISLPGFDGKIINLYDLKGKIVLIDFWASWCGPCRRNNPKLVELYKKYHDRGFEIYGISIDSNAANWKQAVQQDQLPWIQVNDNKGWYAPSTITYDVNAIPASYLLDKDGIIRLIDFDERNIESKLKSLLKK